MFTISNDWIMNYVAKLQADRNTYCIAVKLWEEGDRVGMVAYTLCDGFTIKHYLYTRKNGQTGVTIKTMSY